MINYVFPGTFDPLTLGHVSIIEVLLCLSKQDDIIIIGVSSSVFKKPMLKIDERIAILESFIQKNTINHNISVQKIIGNTADFIQNHNGICIRGIRNFADFEYESYWPISKSSKSPIKIFVLIFIFNYSDISSTLFRKTISEQIADSTSKNYELFSLAPQETLDFFSKKQSGLLEMTLNQDNSLKKSAANYQNNACIVFNDNVLDFGNIEFIKTCANLTQKLIIFVPQNINNEKLDFNTRFILIKNEIARCDLSQSTEIMPCNKIDNDKHLIEIFKSHNINQFFIEIREFHTRKTKNLENLYNQIKFYNLYQINCMCIIVEKFRDISQSILFSMIIEDIETHKTFEHSHLQNFLSEENYTTALNYINNTLYLGHFCQYQNDKNLDSN